MSTQRAVVHKSKGVAEVRSDVPLPKLRDQYINVRTKAVALNPTDWKAVDNNPTPGAIVGCDYAGVVEAVGKAAEGRFKVGDRIAGFVRGANPVWLEDGAFAEHITAKHLTQAKIPDSLSFEDASTLGVGVTTVGQGLFQSLGLPLYPAKVEKPTYVLIYGGSTATGTLAVQFAKLAGATVIATASPHNFDLVKSLGADQVFDYRDPDVGAKIRKATNDELSLVFDTISEHGSPQISADAISSKGGHYSALLFLKDKFPRDDVKSSLTLAYTALGEWYNDKFPENQEDAEFGLKFWELTEKLLAEGKIKTHPAKVQPGGLDGVVQGLQDLKDGKVSGVKLVYKVD